VSTEQHWAGMKKNMGGKQAKTAKKTRLRKMSEASENKVANS